MNTVKGPKGTKAPFNPVEDQLVCPVCKKVLHLKNLPDKESIINDNLYSEGGVRIVDSHVTLRCEFGHWVDEQGNSLDEPHEISSVIVAEFDNKGECALFNIVEVFPLQKEVK